MGSTALKAADQSNPGLLLGDDHLSDVASENPGGQRLFMSPTQAGGSRDRPGIAMLGESIVGHYLTYYVFVNDHPSSGIGNQFPTGFKESEETGTTLLIRHVCIFRDTVCTRKVISSCFHKAKETVLILSDPSQKKRSAPQIQDYI